MKDLLEVLLIIFGLSVTIGLLYNTFSIVGGAYYDLKALAKEKDNRKHPYNKINRYAPLLTIIISAHNEEEVIRRCLKSILSSTYRKFEIIVVNDGSQDKTASIVRQYISEQPNRNIRLVSKRANGGKGAAINYAFRAHAHGDLIMTLDADCELDRYALKRAVRYFASGQICALSPNVRIRETKKILGIMQQFEYLAGFRSKKFNSLSNSEYIVGGAGAVYTKQIFKKVHGFDESMLTEDIALSLSISELGNKANRIIYASDVLVVTGHAPNYKSLLRQRYRWKFGGLQAIYAQKHMLFNRSGKYTKMLSWIRLPLALWGEIQLLLEPLFFSYFLYLAIRFRNPTLFIIACITMTVILLIIVWSDEHLSASTKLKMMFLSPFMYIVFYIMTSIQLIAAFRCLINRNSIVDRNLVRGTWLSPDRVGNKA